jgi:zinc protease
MSKLLMRGGAGRSGDKISEEFNRLDAVVYVTDSVDRTDVHIVVPTQHFLELLRLIVEVFKTPEFAPSELEQLRQQELANAEKERADSTKTTINGIRRELTPFGPGDPRHIETPEEQTAALRNVSLTDVKTFYTSIFANACGGDLTVVGDFDPTALRKEAEDVLGGWQCRSHHAKLSYPYIPIPASHREVRMPGATVSLLAVGLPMNVGDDDQDFAAILMGNEILGGGSGFGNRLFDRIRTELGLCYGVESDLDIHPGDKSSGMMIFAGCPTQNLGRVEGLIKEELTKVLNEGVTEKEVAIAKNGWLQRNALNRGQDQSLAALLVNLDGENRTLAWESNLEKQVSQLTPEIVQTAMARHIDLHSMSILLVGDVGKP